MRPKCGCINLCSRPSLMRIPVAPHSCWHLMFLNFKIFANIVVIWVCYYSFSFHFSGYEWHWVPFHIFTGKRYFFEYVLLHRLFFPHSIGISPNSIKLGDYNLTTFHKTKFTALSQHQGIKNWGKERRWSREERQTNKSKVEIKILMENLEG